jgi:hypothetical protein
MGRFFCRLAVRRCGPPGAPNKAIHDGAGTACVTSHMPGVTSPAKCVPSHIGAKRPKKPESRAERFAALRGTPAAKTDRGRLGDGALQVLEENQSSLARVKKECHGFRRNEFKTGVFVFGRPREAIS